MFIMLEMPTSLQRKRDGEDEERGPKIAILQVPIPVAAKLGTALITLNDLINLEVGDVLVTDTNIMQLARVDANGVPLYYGRPGTRNGKCVIKLTGLTEKQKREPYI